MPQRKALVLASSSPYRRQLLDRLGLDYVADSPEIDETPHRSESPAAYVARLAEEKARAVAERHPGALIIGSDQACVRDGEILGKPGTLERAHQQLLSASGRTVLFTTAVCLLDTDANEACGDVVTFRVRFRTLDDAAVQRYLEREPAVDAAGSFHSEAYGITLFESMDGSDPTALVGLPLIALCRLLRQAGLQLP